MPVLGQIATGKELGKRGSATDRLIWQACPICGKRRWVYLKKGKPEYDLCYNCSNKIKSTGRKQARNNNWKGGQFYKYGYVFILRPAHLRSNNNGYVKRAIVILEDKLGRPLLPGMDSHHINGIKDDDHPENLLEVPHNEHPSLHRTLRKWSSILYAAKIKRGGSG